MTKINVENVTKNYGSVTALDDVSLTIPEESSYGLLGTNGAGKTTLFKLLIGHETPDAGDISVGGVSPRSGVAVRKIVGYVPEHASFPGTFSGREVLNFHADIRGVPKTTRSRQIDRALDLVGLSSAADRSVEGYSKGMNRRLGLATVLVAEPPVLLLDEPTSGLDPQGVEAFHDVIRSFLRETAVTVVFSTHTLSEINDLCDQIAILHQGSLKTSGTVDSLRQSVGSVVSLKIWLEDGSSMAETIARIQGEPGLESIERVQNRIEIRCDRSESYDLLVKLHDLAQIENFEVSQPGIDEVFRTAVDGAEDSTVGNDE